MSEMSDMFKLVNAMKLAKTARVGMELTYFDVIELLGELESLKDYIAELEDQLEDWTNNGWAEDYKARIAELEGCIEELKKRIVELNWADRPALVGELKSRIAELEAETKALKENSKWLARLTESSRKENEHLRQTLSIYAAKQRWIPVGERLPKKSGWKAYVPGWGAPAVNKRYLVKLQNDWVCIATYYLRVGGGYWKDDRGQELADGVVSLWKGLEE